MSLHEYVIAFPLLKLEWAMNIYIFVLSTDPSRWFSLPPLFLLTFSVLDAGNAAHQILSLLGGSPTEEKKELLKNVMELHHSVSILFLE